MQYVSILILVTVLQEAGEGGETEGEEGLSEKQSRTDSSYVGVGTGDHHRNHRHAEQWTLQ